MKKRNITFITGTVVNYDLTSSDLEILLEKLSNYSAYRKVAKKVYKVESLEVLEGFYDSLSPYPSDGNDFSTVYFFVGEIVLNATIKAVKDEVLFKCFNKFSTLFSCSKITDDVYKVTEL